MTGQNGISLFFTKLIDMKNIFETNILTTIGKYLQFNENLTYKFST